MVTKKAASREPGEGVFLERIVELDAYPLTEPDSDRYREMVRGIRAELDDVGCSVVRGFLTSEAIGHLQREANELRPHAHENNILSNAYSTQDDPSLPEEHPVRIFMERTNAFVPKACIPAESALRTLYHAEAFKRFVADCMDEPVVHEYADPYAGLVINVLKPNCQHPWHYDTNEFIVSTLLQAPEDGGVFEYCPNIRTPNSENYDRVGRVLRDEDRSEVRQLVLRAGDLQLFKGRFALHRVARVRGERHRLTGIFAYAREPGMVGKAERTRQLFGRVSEEHLAAASGQPRKDGLID